MTRNKLALEQLRVEKQRLNEENERQARSKSNMKLTILCIIDMEQLFYNLYYGAYTTSNPRAVPAATREKSSPTCEQHAWHISNEFICVSLCAFVLLLFHVNCGVLSVLLSTLITAYSKRGAKSPCTRFRKGVLGSQYCHLTERCSWFSDPSRPTVCQSWWLR